MYKLHESFIFHYRYRYRNWKNIRNELFNGWLRKKGVQAVPYKTIQSGGKMKDGQLQSEGVAFYKALSVLPYSDETLCTYCFEDPVSPHLAMKRSNETIHIPTIMSQLKKLQAENEFVFVEGAGGLAVPPVDQDEETYMMTDF